MNVRTMEIQIAKSDGEVEACFSVMNVLRPHLVEEGFVEKIRRQEKSGYQLVFVWDGLQEVSAIAGYRIHETTAWGKILYIDDLVTDPTKLRKGYAGALLEWLEKTAKREACDEMHLDSGYGRQDAHRLYLNSGFNIVSHHFSKALKS